MIPRKTTATKLPANGAWVGTENIGKNITEQVETGKDFVRAKIKMLDTKYHEDFNKGDHKYYDIDAEDYMQNNCIPFIEACRNNNLVDVKFYAKNHS